MNTTSRAPSSWSRRARGGFAAKLSGKVSAQTITGGFVTKDDVGPDELDVRARRSSRSCRSKQPHDQPGHPDGRPQAGRPVRQVHRLRRPSTSGTRWRSAATSRSATTAPSRQQPRGVRRQGDGPQPGRRRAPGQERHHRLPAHRHRPRRHLRAVGDRHGRAGRPRRPPGLRHGRLQDQHRHRRGRHGLHPGGRRHRDARPADLLPGGLRLRNRRRGSPRHPRDARSHPAAQRHPGPGHRRRPGAGRGRRDRRRGARGFAAFTISPLTGFRLSGFKTTGFTLFPAATSLDVVHALAATTTTTTTTTTPPASRCSSRPPTWPPPSTARSSASATSPTAPGGYFDVVFNDLNGVGFKEQASIKDAAPEFEVWVNGARSGIVVDPMPTKVAGKVNTWRVHLDRGAALDRGRGRDPVPRGWGHRQQRHRLGWPRPSGSS